MGTEGRNKKNQVKPREAELSIFSSNVHGVGSKKLWIFPIDQMTKIHRYILEHYPEVKLSRPGVCVCNSCHNSIIWRAESRTHLSKHTRPSTEHSQKARMCGASH